MLVQINFYGYLNSGNLLRLEFLPEISAARFNIGKFISIQNDPILPPGSGIKMFYLLKKSFTSSDRMPIFVTLIFTLLNKDHKIKIQEKYVTKQASS